MNIQDYKRDEMSKEIRNLFLTIYPNRPDIADKMCFDENMDRSVSTKVAIVDGRVIGQANIFLFKNNSEIANLGYHIHPDFHKMGIGSKLSQQAIEDAKNKGVKILLVRTDNYNVASINLAKKLGFIEPSDEFIEKHKDMIFHNDIENMVCLYRLL